MTDEVVPNRDLPFYYDFLFENSIPEEQKPGVISAFDKKILAAKEFLNYLSQVERDNQGVSNIRSDELHEIQGHLSAPIVEGYNFLKLNQDYNHTTYEVNDIKDSKRKLEEGVSKSTTAAQEAKKLFHEAEANLEAKANKLDTSSLGKLSIKEDAVFYHVEKVCKWILDVYYDLPSSRFDWNNFRKNVFAADKGQDFKNRIKGLFIPKLYDSQIEVCQYVLTTIPMFKQKINNPNFELILSTAQDIIDAYNARSQYTKAKKTISDNSLKIVETKLDLDQSSKVSKTTEPFIQKIYDKLISKENSLRSLNLVDFHQDNQAEYAFHKGSGGKVSSFLRGEVFAHYENDEKLAEKSKEKKPFKVTPKDVPSGAVALPQKTAEPNKIYTSEVPNNAAPGGLTNTVSDNKNVNLTSTAYPPLTAGADAPIPTSGRGEEFEYDTSFEMGPLD